MKTKYTLLVLIFTYIQSYSQTYTVDNIAERIMNSTHIFEGRVIRSDSYWSRSNRYIYTSSTIQMTKIFKGAADLSCGTVEIITEGGRVGDDRLEISHNLVLQKGMMGIFLCDTNIFEMPQTDYYLETNSIKLYVPYGDEGFVRYYNDGINYSVADWQFSLDSLSQVYSLVELYTTLTLVDCGGAIIQPRPSLPILNAPTYPNIDLSLNPIFQAATSSGTGSVYFNLLNRHITSTTPKYFEFDIALNDDVDTGNFNSCVMAIEYPSAVFGNDIVSNSNIILSTTGIFSGSSAYILNPIDDPLSSNRLLIQVLPDTTSSDPLINLPLYIQGYSFPTPAIHVQIEIIDCNYQGFISMPPPNPFVPPNWSTSQYYNASTITNYDLPYWSSIIIFPSCGLNIDNVLASSFPITAGTKDTITILGLGFDTARGNGNVWQRNSNDLSYIHLDSVDYKLWNDTVIKFILPGNIENPSTYNNNDYGMTGSGRVKVMTNAGDSVQGDSIHIFYSIRDALYQSPFYYQKSMNNLTKEHGSSNDGVTFMFDTSFSHTLHPDRWKAIDISMKEWICVSNVNYILGDSIIPPADTAALDNICIIQFGTLPIDKVMKTATHEIGYCGQWFVDETDIIVNESLRDSFEYKIHCEDTISSNKYDFVAALIHEFGHSLSLNHLTDYDAIMYAKQRPINNPVLPQDRYVHLYSDYSADSASSRVVDSATAVTCASIPTMTKLFLLQCDTLPLRLPYSGSHNLYSCFNGVNEIESPLYDIRIFPNPTANNLTMNFLSKDLQEYYIRIIDVYGKVVYSRKQKAEFGENTCEFNVGYLTSGVYCINVDAGNGKVSMYKFIKQ